MGGTVRSGVIDALASFLAAAGLFVAVLGPLVFLVECVEWLTSREWPGLTVADGLSILGIVREVEENDAQRWHDVMLALPLSLALYFGGVAAFFLGINIGDRNAGQNLISQLLSDD